ncbi:hypothetical protein FOZ60_005776 [Perkinsus olseni]|uniref:Ankyrin Repeat Protein n=1 Tax=Perkinsus olseni TaxID=32597 RepID=A0A7J6NSJ8_PEROL|nr:hypothetical protein FOZ60_005776 [Perkinsus olseni]
MTAGAVASLSDDHSPNGHWAKSPLHLPNSAPKIFRRRTSGEVSGIQGLILEGSMEMDDEELLSKAQELRNMFAVALCKHGRLYEEDDNGQTREESEESESPRFLKRATPMVLSQFTEKWMPELGSIAIDDLDLALPQRRTVSFLLGDESGDDIPRKKDACQSMQELLNSRGVEATYVDPETQESLLLLAVGSSCSVDVVSLLIENSANPNDVSHVGGLTPLMLAVINNDRDMVKCLTTHGAQLCVTDSIGRTPFDLTTDKEMLALLQAMDLHTATRNNDLAACQAAIDAGIDLNWVHPKTGTTALYGAVDKLHEEMVVLLLNGKADPNTAPTTGFSPLYAAANRGVPKLSKILLEYNADPNKKIGNGETPLFAALKKAKARGEMVELLLKAGADVNVYSNQQLSPFRVALEKNCDQKLLNILLEFGALPDAPNPETGDTILQQVCQKPHDKNALPVLRKLVDNFHCDVNLANPRTGATALHYAAVSRNPTAVIDFLFDRGADPLKTDLEERTPLYWAIDKMKIDNAKLLIDKARGIRSKYGEAVLEEIVNLPDELNSTCLSVCLAELNLEMSELLVHECHAEVRARCGIGKWSLAELLVDAWTDHIKDRGREDPRALSISPEDERLVALWSSLFGLDDEETLGKIRDVVESQKLKEAKSDTAVEGVHSPSPGSRRSQDAISPPALRRGRSEHKFGCVEVDYYADHGRSGV